MPSWLCGHEDVRQLSSGLHEQREREREREGRTAGDDEMENPRGRIGGKRSNTYSGGTFAARNSYMTSLMVLLGRSV